MQRLDADGLGERSQVWGDEEVWKNRPEPDAATGPNFGEPERDWHPPAFGGIK